MTSPIQPSFLFIPNPNPIPKFPLFQPLNHTTMNPIANPQSQISITLPTNDEIPKPDYDSDADSQPNSSNTSKSGTTTSSFSTVELRLQRLEQRGNDYAIVSRSLVNGMGELGTRVVIDGVYKKMYDWDAMDEARLSVFRVFAGAVAGRNGGESNVKFGWVGAGRDEIREIMLHGFCRVRDARGVRLSAGNVPIESVKTLVPDSDGLLHVLLCRVILGRPQQISFDSHKDQTTSAEFDSGVDNLLSPTKYFISEHHMNTRILPVYIVSFRADSLPGTPSIRRPTSPHMSISGLINRLTNYVSSSKIAVIQKLHHAYHKNKISRTTFIRHLRKIVGDDVLRVIVQGLR